MEIALAVLADYAAVTDHGKLVVAGIFDTINVPSVPAVHPMMALALRVSSRADEPAEHDLTVRLVDPDGQPVVRELKARVAFPRSESLAGGTVQVVLQMPGIRFEKQGPHAIDIFIDGQHVRSLQLHLHVKPHAPQP